jgi:hypothetical protein
MKNLISTEIMLFFNVSQHYYKSQCFTFMLLTFKQLCYSKAVCVSIFKLPSILASSHTAVEREWQERRCLAAHSCEAVREHLPAGEVCVGIG